MPRSPGWMPSALRPDPSASVLHHIVLRGIKGRPAVRWFGCSVGMGEYVASGQSLSYAPGARPRGPRLDALPLFVRNPGRCNCINLIVLSGWPCPAVPASMSFHSSSGSFGPAHRPEPSLGVLRHVMLRRTERHSLVFAPWVLPQAIPATARWQVIRSKLT